MTYNTAGTELKGRLRSSPFDLASNGISTAFNPNLETHALDWVPVDILRCPKSTHELSPARRQDCTSPIASERAPQRSREGLSQSTASAQAISSLRPSLASPSMRRNTTAGNPSSILEIPSTGRHAGLASTSTEAEVLKRQLTRCVHRAQIEDHEKILTSSSLAGPVTYYRALPKSPKGLLPVLPRNVVGPQRSPVRRRLGCAEKAFPVDGRPLWLCRAEERLQQVHLKTHALRPSKQ